MARTKDLKAKERKQKIILGALGVVLIVVVAVFVLPMVMKGGASSSASAPATTTTPAAGAASVPGAGTPVSAAHSEVVFVTSVDRLSSFRRFTVKDPFNAHGADSTDVTSAPAAAPPVATPPPAARTRAVAVAKQAGPVFGTVEGQKVAQPTSRSIPSAVLRFNGKTIRVALGEAFPKKHPTFRLAGVKPGGLIVSVVKGSLADGSQSIDLLKGAPLTLVNTTTGGRFTIEFLSASKAS